MPAFLLGLAPLLAIVFRYAIVKVILALGISSVSYIGISSLTDGLFDVLFNMLDSTDADLLVWISMLGIDQSLQIVTNAFLTAISIKITLGAFNRISFGGVSD